MENDTIKLEKTWREVLQGELTKPYFTQLHQKVREEYLYQTVYPHPEQVFSAFTHCPFNQVKVVILGQDPYHGKSQAHGLSFSVQSGTAIPPSLKNIYKELQTDCNRPPREDGDLTDWAKQGVLLLNTTLTVKAGSPLSHTGLGWEDFTDAVIDILNQKKDHLVFILWGAHANKKADKIDQKRHHIISAPHPSPLSAHRGFFGSRPFSQANAYLEATGQTPIKW